MNKKVSEILDELECEWIDAIVVEEDKRLQQISFQKISKRAMQGIQEEREISLEHIQKKKGKRIKLLKRIILPLVAAISLMGITAVAINSNENLREILGETFPFIQSEIQSIKKIAIDQGVIFTAEAAAIENKSGTFFLSVEKEDGSTFDEETVLRKVLPSQEKKGGMGWGSYCTLTEDRKKLMVVVDLSGSRELYNQTIAFTAYDIGIWEEGKVKPTINLQEVYQKTLFNQVDKTPRSWEDYRQAESIGISLIKQFPDYQLDKVELDGEKLSIITSYLSPNGENLIEHIEMKLIDRRTGKEVQGDGGSSSWDRADERNKMCDRFLGVTEADLPYLELDINYRYFEPMVPGEWHVAFELNKNENVKEQKLFKKIKAGDKNVTIHDIQISKMGVKVEGLRHHGSSYDLNGYVQMKDGSQIELLTTGGWGKWNLIFGKHYKFGDQIGERKVQKLESINKVKNKKGAGGTASEGFGGSEISIATRQGIDGGLEIPQIINLENVERIILEGVEIRIR
ncbi:MAG: hypothetical protein ACRC1P_08155 [Cellulosilyticaceae bacterium]